MDSEYCLVVKGNPKVIWNICTYVLVGGKTVAKYNTWQQKFNQAEEYFRQNGEQIIAFAKLHLPRKSFPKGFKFNSIIEQLPLRELSFVGMVAINDPPRWNTSYSIAKCRKAGIKVMMLTDDTATAAISVARKLNIALAKPIVKQVEQKQATPEE